MRPASTEPWRCFRQAATAHLFAPTAFAGRPKSTADLYLGVSWFARSGVGAAVLKRASRPLCQTGLCAGPEGSKSPKRCRIRRFFMIIASSQIDLSRLVMIDLYIIVYDIEYL